MKKIWIRAAILLAVFVAGVAGFSCLMNNKTTDNKADLETARIPCMAIRLGDYEINRMYGYSQDMDVSFMRDSLTPLGTDKTLSVSITPNGREINSLVYEVRTADGSSVIENDKIKSFQEEADGKKTAQFTLQKSILMNQEYSLVFTLDTEEGQWNYYTRIIQRAGLNTEKYVEFVDSFYTKTFTKESRGDLATYLESDSSASNNSFNSLNIHSSQDMITWGNLAPEISRPGIPAIQDINENTGSISLTYYISAESENGEIERYQVDEFYRMRYDQTRVRLLDFERSAKQVLTTEQNIVSAGSLNLGVTDKNVQYRSDSEGNIIAFVQQGDLWAYNVETNKLIRIFSFRNAGSNDERNDNDQHGIKLIRVEKDGDIDFLLYGYMNRGSHEGQVGTMVCHYSAEQNVIQERFFLESRKSFEFLEEEIGKLSYVSKEGSLYLLLEGVLYEISMEEKTYTAVQEEVKEECLAVSENGRYVAWMSGMEPYDASEIVFMDLETGERRNIQAEPGSRVRLFGFINNDVVYGSAKEENIQKEKGIFAMDRIEIQNHKGETVKEYSQEGYYVMDVEVQDNMLELDRATKQGDSFIGTAQDQIMNNVKSKQDESFSLASATIERQANVISIQFSSESSTQEPLVVEAKFAETMEDTLLKMEIPEDKREQYYVYAKGGLYGIYENAAQAIGQADAQAGIVLTRAQQYLWERGNTPDKASIDPADLPKGMKNAAPEAAALQEQVKSQGTIIDLTGCTLEQALYEVGVQRPVVVKGENGQAQIIVGFDSYNTILYDPATGKTGYKGLQDSTKTFEENGNVFLCYMENTAGD